MESTLSGFQFATISFCERVVLSREGMLSYVENLRLCFYVVCDPFVRLPGPYPYLW